MAAGRPSKFKAAYVKQAVKLCEAGFTDPEIADFFDVNRATVNRWKHAYPEFRDALKTGKAPADDRVERSLFQRAIGYEQEEVKIFMPAGAQEPVYAKFTAKYAPDVTACIFWLKNRRPESWRDRPDGEGGDDLSEAISKLIDRLPC